MYIDLPVIYGQVGKKTGAGGLGCRAGLVGRGWAAELWAGLGAELVAGLDWWLALGRAPVFGFSKGGGVWFCAYGVSAFLELAFSPKGGGLVIHNRGPSKRGGN